MQSRAGAVVDHNEVFYLLFRIVVVKQHEVRIRVLRVADLLHESALAALDEVELAGLFRYISGNEVVHIDQAVLAAEFVCTVEVERPFAREAEPGTTKGREREHEARRVAESRRKLRWRLDGEIDSSTSAKGKRKANKDF